MTKYNILIYSILPLCLFGDCPDCEAYKTQVINDCDSLLVECGYIRNTYSYIETYCNTIDNNVSSSGSSVILNSTDDIRRNCSVGLSTVSAIENFVNSVKSTAQSLECNSSNTVGSCDCAQYLQTLIGLVQTCNQTLSGVSSGLDAVRTSIGDVPSNGATISDNLYSIEDASNNLLELLVRFLDFDSQNQTMPLKISDFASVTNSSIYLSYLLSGRTFTSDEKVSLGFFLGSAVNDYLYTVSYNYPYLNWTSKRFLNHAPPGGWSSVATLNNQSLSSAIKSGFAELMFGLSALNTYSRTNLYEFVASRESLRSVSEKFSIFNDFVFSSDAPLSMYTDNQTDGSYHDYLTNYYIKVSKGQQSGSDNFTNWFSRIEILLASLVFRDDGTNFVENADNTSEFETTLSQSVDTLSQAVSLPENVTGKIDNMGQSFLGLLEEWQTIVNGNSLPSQFVLCDINLSSQNRDSSPSPLSSFRLETSLDSGFFRQFLDTCHAVTTILFTMLFVWLSIMLLSFLLTSLAKLVHFCYLVYSSLFGG